jgi:hypothetical protein
MMSEQAFLDNMRDSFKRVDDVLAARMLREDSPHHKTALRMRVVSDQLYAASRALKAGDPVTAMECVTVGRRAITDAALELERVTGEPISGALV